MEVEKISKCIVCRDEIKSYHDCFEGGDILISFGYGSRYDQLGSPLPFPNTSQKDIDKLLQCDQIRAKICDDCFELIFPMCEGYEIRNIEERII